MGLRTRRLLQATVLLLLLLALLVLTWTALDWPPPRLIIKYGFPPTGGPTGRRRTIEGIEFIELKPGYFRMGSHYQCEEGSLLGRICAPLGIGWGTPPKHGNECPTRWVEVAYSFWIAKTEVTNEQYERYDPDHDETAYLKYHYAVVVGGGDPVVYVSWGDAKRYCAWLAERSGLAVRLPSEAEWECACRAGSRTEFCFGDDVDGLAEYAWCGERDGQHKVGVHRPNAWGLNDLHGNVWEWVEDTYHQSYDGAPADGSQRTDRGEARGGASHRAFRGGGWFDASSRCRSASRDGWLPSTRSDQYGFRPAITPSDK